MSSSGENLLQSSNEAACEDVAGDAPGHVEASEEDFLGGEVVVIPGADCRCDVVEIALPSGKYTPQAKPAPRGILAVRQRQEAASGRLSEETRSRGVPAVADKMICGGRNTSIGYRLSSMTTLASGCKMSVQSLKPACWAVGHSLYQNVRSGVRRFVHSIRAISTAPRTEGDAGHKKEALVSARFFMHDGTRTQCSIIDTEAIGEVDEGSRCRYIQGSKGTHEHFVQLRRHAHGLRQVSDDGGPQKQLIFTTNVPTCVRSCDRTTSETGEHCINADDLDLETEDVIDKTFKRNLEVHVSDDAKTNKRIIGYRKTKRPKRS